MTISWLQAIILGILPAYPVCLVWEVQPLVTTH